MPELNEMKCTLCEEVKPKDELERYDGFCFDCHSVMNEANEKVEQQGPSDVDDADPELQRAVDGYNKRREYMKEYNSRPDIIEKRRAYMKGRNEKIKMLVRKAKDLGLLEDRS